MLEKLLQIINEAGEILIRYRTTSQKKEIHFKGEVDLVTSADLEVQQFLKTKLAREFPDVAFFGEEDEKADVDQSSKIMQDKLFVVDPIDGTTNFVHNNPHYCISLAYKEKGVGKIGLVYAPEMDLLYYAEKGQPAYARTRYETKRTVQVSATGELIHALVITGFACIRDRKKPDNIPLFGEVIYNVRGTRRYGAAALDLCFVADGRADLFWEMNLNPWDTAAGIIILEAAGGRVTDLSGGRDYDEKRELVASNGPLHADFLSLVQKVMFKAQ
jgi:myo-inositol-1(or 4)-monophosphatase